MGDTNAPPSRIAHYAITYKLGEGGMAWSTPRATRSSSADGQRFLLLTVVDETRPSSITIVTNWMAERKEQ